MLDEPFSALDYQTRIAVSSDVYNIIKKEKKTVIMITHDIAEAISLADRIIVLTSRPSCIKNIISIDIDSSISPLDKRKCPQFTVYYEKIWKEIDYHEE